MPQHSFAGPVGAVATLKYWSQAFAKEILRLFPAGAQTYEVVYTRCVSRFFDEFSQPSLGRLGVSETRLFRERSEAASPQRAVFVSS